MRNHFKLFLISVVVLTFMPLRAYCETYTHTIYNDPTQEYSRNIIWKYSFNPIFKNYQINSAKITLSVKVSSWGDEMNIDILASDTINFVLPNDRICELNPSTNPSSSNFYTVTCPLSADELKYIVHNGEIYIATNTYGGTYYLEYIKLTVNVTLPVQFTLTVNSYGAKNVSVLSSTQHSGTTAYFKAVNQGVNVNLVAPQYHGSGAERKRFTDWSGAVMSTERSITFKMDGDKTVTANYVDDREQVGIPSWIKVPTSSRTDYSVVSWGSSSTSGVTYVLEEATNETFTSGLRQAYSGTATSAPISDRSTGVTYYYRIKAIKAGYVDSLWKNGFNGGPVSPLPGVLMLLLGE